MLYRYLVRPLLYALPAETAHHLALFALRVVQTMPLGLWLLRLLFASRRSRQVRTLGLVFPTPVGLAAGFDKDARVAPALFALGFGSVEVGTVTAEAQPGNPRPRLFRLIEDRALLNRMGFNNEGAEAVALRLARIARPRGSVLGVNIGKSKVTPADAAVADYEKSARLLGPYADYLVVNVSSPNTPGLRDLQAVQTLRPILEAVRKTLDATVKERKVPLLVKIAPDLADEDIRAIARMSLEIGLDGIIATNTTISRQGLSTPPAKVQALGAGGVSGAPLKDRALDVLQILSAIVGSELTLVGAGGIETAADVEKRLSAGAQLVQIYSSLVFFGPGLPGRLAGRLAGSDPR